MNNKSNTCFFVKSNMSGFSGEVDCRSFLLWLLGGSMPFLLWLLRGSRPFILWLVKGSKIGPYGMLSIIHLGWFHDNPKIFTLCFLGKTLASCLKIVSQSSLLVFFEQKNPVHLTQRHLLDDSQRANISS